MTTISALKNLFHPLTLSFQYVFLQVICETSDNMRAMQRAVFDIPDPFLNPRVNCDALPGVDLDLWKERVTCKG